MKHLSEILYIISWGMFAGLGKLLLSIDTTVTPPFYILTRVGMYLMHRTDLTL